ncbi:MAG: porin [Usitatibacter sp.]
MQLRYRLIVVAMGAACGMAQAQSTVEIYGTAFPFFDNAKTTGATSAAPAAADRPNQVPASTYTGLNDPARNRITVGTSALGFRGTEQINPSLKVVWQMESGFQIDQNTGPGLGARDSKVGLQGPWGQVFLGQWDTPYKYISLPVNPLKGGYVFDRTAITANPGFGVPNTTTQFTRIGGKADASFDKRVGNSVQYWSPNWGGVSFRLDHSVNETKGPVIAGGPNVSPTITSASVQYDAGQLSLRYSYEQHDDYFGMTQVGGSAAGTATNASSRDRGHKFVVLYRIGNTRITGPVEQLEYKNDDSLAGAVSQYKRTAYYGVVEQFFANNSSVFVSYGRAADGSCTRVGGAACSTTALGADYMTLGFIYRFSKRTEVFAAYYRLNNKQNAQYSPGPTVSTAAVAPGADTVGMGVGMIHFF